MPRSLYQNSKHRFDPNYATTISVARDTSGVVRSIKQIVRIKDRYVPEAHAEVEMNSSRSRQVFLMKEAPSSEMLTVSVATLRRWRLLNQGPPFLKIGAAVRY